MSIHNEAKQEDVAEKVLLAGDPLRAQYIAKNYLENAVCYNRVRNMLGYTGTYDGKRISVQGSGMGMPSMSIYAYELINFYKANSLIRIGTCGSFQADVKVKNIILAMGASTDSAMNRPVFGGADFSNLADYYLLRKAEEDCRKKDLPHAVGNVLTSDHFYVEENPVEYYKKWIEYGILAVEMETAALYSLGARHEVDTLSILTVSDNLVTGEHASPDDRETAFDNMMKLALETI
ncbi:MAG: purine-nucleoside phosphorylase [Bacteroidales bacterium]|nr:purine-nucleoside phosphorylase [Bacteroidales bacterium]MCF8332645.1 purine-nucleoside phosphorylase [Bacteroidales bacterium]